MVRPVMKSTIPWHRDEDGVHFRIASEMLSLDDVDGSIGFLIDLLDGSRDVDQLYHDLVARFPSISRAEFDTALAELDASKLLQDAAAPTEGLTEEHRERWSRNLGFFEAHASLTRSRFDFQRRIRDTKVAMLGLGGVGSHVLMDMVALGFTNIRVVDYDTVELSNLNRQVLYGQDVMGQAKTELTREWTKRFNPEVTIDAVSLKIASADDVRSVVHDRDLVIAALDRPKTHIVSWLNEGCVSTGTPFMAGGVDHQRVFHYTVVPGLTGCIQCWRTQVEAADPTSKEIFRRQREHDDAGNRFLEDMAAFNGLVVLHVAFLIGELVRLSARVARPLSIGRMLEATFQRPVLAEGGRWVRDPECDVCGNTTPRPEWEWLRDVGSPPLEPQEFWHDV
jgi:molybdopterin/thiamine biosynthesis adenylyltransferase